MSEAEEIIKNYLASQGKKGGKSRWSKISKKERSRMMSNVSKGKSPHSATPEELFEAQKFVNKVLRKGLPSTKSLK